MSEFHSKMDENEIKSELSFVYVHAVASRLGCSCQKSDRQTDNMGIDLTLRFKGEFQSIGPCTIALDVQLKSTSRPIEHDNNRRGIIVDGLGKNVYDDFSDETRTPHAILVLFVLPDNPEEWLTHTDEQLLLRRCAYWVSLRGAGPCPGNTKRIFIPESQIFNVEQLRENIFKPLANKGELRYEI